MCHGGLHLTKKRSSKYMFGAAQPRAGYTNPRAMCDFGCGVRKPRVINLTVSTGAQTTPRCALIHRSIGLAVPKSAYQRKASAVFLTLKRCPSPRRGSGIAETCLDFTECQRVATITGERKVMEGGRRIGWDGVYVPVLGDSSGRHKEGERSWRREAAGRGDVGGSKERSGTGKGGDENASEDGGKQAGGNVALGGLGGTDRRGGRDRG
ncbi:hypothetical protein B0H16DRAFT_1480380 [Mycena metata]|uniref:Uncharacterized protein n=1 Tax=Mycena metata TaxID=1033252 RepID=A0AAD7H3E4_9AGAR|nr:hypothetical protein B0H16DRAFT_1480380 [Mycena metata]